MVWRTRVTSIRRSLVSFVRVFGFASPIRSRLLAFSPKGNIAVAAIYGGSNNKNAWYYHRNGSIAVLRIDGNKVTKIKEIEIGGLPEPVVFTPDGGHILVGNYLDQDFSILRVKGTDVTDTGKRFKVPGHPGSARGSPK